MAPAPRHRHPSTSNVPKVLASSLGVKVCKVLASRLGVKVSKVLASSLGVKVSKVLAVGLELPLGDVGGEAHGGPH